MSAGHLPGRIRGISLDLGNTLYPLRPAEMSQTVRHLHRFLETRLSASLSFDELDRLYVEIRDRQFAENRATLCENDFDQRLREMISHVHREPNDALIAEASEAYGAGFVCALQLPRSMQAVVRRLGERFEGRVAVCSNFILSGPIRAVLERDGLLPLLAGVVVSCDVGFVKPHPAPFAAVSKCLGLQPAEVAHVGDDLDADILGARRAGMATVYTAQFCSPAAPDAIAAAGPDMIVSGLDEL